jgi:hypothetical protein
MNKPTTGQIHNVIPLFAGKQWIVRIAYYVYRVIVDEVPYTNFEYLSREPLNTDPVIYLTAALIYFREGTYQLYTELLCDNKQVGSNNLSTTHQPTSTVTIRNTDREPLSDTIYIVKQFRSAACHNRSIKTCLTELSALGTLTPSFAHTIHKSN